jgi:hypothetical protein
MNHALIVGPIVLVLCSACTSTVPMPGQAQTTSVASAAPAKSPSLSSSGKSTPLPITFVASAQQARMVATLVAFLDAYNAGRVDAALPMLTDDVSMSDCDYRAVRVIQARGTDQARQWLRERAAQHDQLVLESVRNENPDPSTGSHVVAVSYARRTSDTLRALGFRDGIVPHTATKVSFTTSDDRIRGFANGGSDELCRPS